MFGAAAQNIEPMKKRTAVNIKIFFLPNKSARCPFNIAPIVAPTRVEDTKIP